MMLMGNNDMYCDINEHNIWLSVLWCPL